MAEPDDAPELSPAAQNLLKEIIAASHPLELDAADLLAAAELVRARLVIAENGHETIELRSIRKQM